MVIEALKKLFGMGRTPSSPHQRINERLINYWLELRGDRPFPSETEIDPDALSELWASCFLVRTDDISDGSGYRYTYLGAELIEAYGEDITNIDIFNELIAPTNPQLLKKLDEVVRTGKPATDESHFTNRKNVVIKYRSCMLPLGGPSGKVEYILGGMKWKIS